MFALKSFLVSVNHQICAVLLGRAIGSTQDLEHWGAGAWRVGIMRSGQLQVLRSRWHCRVWAPALPVSPACCSLLQGRCYRCCILAITLQQLCPENWAGWGFIALGAVGAQQKNPHPQEWWKISSFIVFLKWDFPSYPLIFSVILFLPGIYFSYTNVFVYFSNTNVIF